jgi:hypothetical protein
VTSVLTSLAMQLFPGEGIDSNIGLLTEKTGEEFDDLAYQVQENSRQIGEEFAKQESVSEEDISVLKNIFTMIFAVVNQKQQAFAKLDDPSFISSKTVNETMVKTLSRALEASFSYLLAPFIDEIIRDDQLKYKVYDAYCEAAEYFLMDQRDLPVGSELADIVCDEIKEIQTELGINIEDSQELLLKFLKPKKGSAGQVSFFNSLYFPSKLAKPKLTEADFIELANQAGWEFSQNQDTRNIGNIFSVTARNAFLLAREEELLERDTQFVTEQSVRHIQTLFDKSVDVILKPLVQAARENPESDEILSKLFNQVGDLVLSSVYGEINGDNELVNLYQQKIYQAYKRVFSQNPFKDAVGSILDCFKKSQSGFRKIEFIASQKLQEGVNNAELNRCDIRSLSAVIGQKIGSTKVNDAEDCDLVLEIFNQIQDLVYEELKEKQACENSVKRDFLERAVAFAQENILEPMVDAVEANEVDSNLEDLKRIMRKHASLYAGLMAPEGSDERLLELLHVRMERMIQEIFAGKTYPPDFSLN